MFRSNPLKARLRAGQPAIGCWITTGVPVLTEIVALAGYDAVMIDHEHGPATLPDALGCLQALQGTSTAGLMRVPWNDPVYVKRALDIGVEGIMFPSISSADEARVAVAACRYPPRGNRGCAYGMVRAADYGLAAADYRARAEDELMVICQIETVAGLANIEQIAAVDGVDCLFIGPWDLSASLGKLGQFDDPDVRDRILDAEAAIRSTGKWLGSLPSLGRTPAQMAEAGVDLVIASAETGLLRDGARGEVEGFRRPVRRD